MLIFRACLIQSTLVQFEVWS